MSTILSFLWVFVTLTLVFKETDANLPGFKARITRRGIRYGNQVAHDMLAEELRTVSIPNQSGTSGRVTYSLWNIQNRGVIVPSTNMALSPSGRGLTWTVSNLGISLYTHWSARYRRGWIKFSSRGRLEVTISEVSLSVTISLGANSRGRPTAQEAACYADIGNVSLRFRGGIAWILNLFRRGIGRRLRNAMRGQICNVVRKLINVDGARLLNKLKVTVPIGDQFLLDYGLVQSPRVQTNFLETKHKGAVYWMTDRSNAPFNPQPFPSMTNDTKMMYLFISDYMANTLAYVAQEQNFLQYNLSVSDLPPDSRSYFDTSCYLMCIGSIIPEIGSDYPNSQVEIEIASISTPVTTMTQEGVTVDTQSSLRFFAHTPENQTAFLLSLSMNLSLSLQASIVNESLTGRIIDHTFTVGVLDSSIGSVRLALVNILLNGIMSRVLIPSMNEILNGGVDLPVTGGVRFFNTRIDHLHGAFVISTDLQLI